MSALRVGVLGCSSFAMRAMIPALRCIEGVELVGIASRSEHKAQDAASQLGCRAYTGYNDLIQSDTVDVIYMPLPTGIHEEWCMKVFEAGKHLLIEKSFAMDYPSAVRMVNAAKEHTCFVAENFQFQTHRQWERIRKIVDSGVLGDIHLLRSTFGFPPLPKDNFRWNRALGGGALLDAGAYMTKVSQLLLGENLQVVGSLLHMDASTGVDKYGEAMLKSDAGKVAQVAFGFDYFYQCRLELLGTQGKLSAGRIFTAPPHLETNLTLETAGGVETITLLPDNHFVNMWQRVAGSIQRGQYERDWAVLLDQARLIHDIRQKAAGS